ncbi:MAG: glycosyltransferase [Bacteroidota bacterium]
MNKLLIIGHNWPEPTTTAAGQRMVQLIDAFLQFDFVVIFVSTASKTPYSLNLETMGVTTISIQLNHSSFDEFVQNLQPDYVVFDRFMVEEQFGWRVTEQVPKAVRILNTEDLHSLRKTREACYTKREEFTLEYWKRFDMTKREIASIYRSDLSLMVSTFEMELLQKELQIPKNLLMHLPFLMDKITNNEEDSWPTFEERIDFITYGNGKHAPNVDSFSYLKKSLWPRIRKKLPEANLKVFGAYLPQQISEMHAPNEGFHVIGWVENLCVEIQRARIVLAPLHFGAGIKGKITDALKNGTPVVTTQVGVEGMVLDGLPKACISESNPKEFANSAIEAYSNQSLWQTAQKKGIALVNSNYLKSKHEERLKVILEDVSQNLEQGRNQNFIGSLLQHQTVLASKYMGKWIEAKNK